MASKDDKTQAKAGSTAPANENAPVVSTSGEKVPTPPEVKTAQAKADERDEDRDDALTVVDPRLDNRTGTQRPPLEEFPAKPQHIDGGDLADMAERPEPAHAIDDDPVARKGMASPGPHGLGDETDEG